MLLAAVAAIAAPADFRLERDAYGAPMISAPTMADAFAGLGYAAGMDRLWQLETSRRIAGGRMAEIDPQAEAADRRTLRFAYADEELRAQAARMPAEVQEAWRAYAEGVNRAIRERTEKGALPENYMALGLQPEPWRIEDSAAVAVMMVRRFGQGGAGELRNLALLEAIKGDLGDRLMDAFDDLAWQNDRRATPTVSLEEDPLAARPAPQPEPDRAESIAHLKSLPARSVLELAGALTALDTAELDLVAERHAAPFKLGSYALAVGPQRSLSGLPMLLHGPQMGHSSPSIVAEASLSWPGGSLAGMHVPGLPGILIGATPRLAWTLTTGVADIEDDCWAPLGPGGGYLYGGQERPLQEVRFERRSRSGASFEVVQQRTHAGPVLLVSRVGKAVYTRRSALWMKELDTAGALFRLYSAGTAAEVQQAVEPYPASFNLFFVTSGGEFGWQYCGHYPERVPGFDPRLPWPLTPETEWRRTLKPAEMPHAFSPASGLLANWNNKPSAWWKNGDTPVWGAIFRNTALLDALGPGPLSRARILAGLREAAEADTYGCGAFLEDIRQASAGLAGPAAQIAAGVDGSQREGDPGSALLARFYGELRRELFSKSLGRLTAIPQAEQALGATLMLNALEGRTRIDHLAGRTRREVVAAALKKAVEALGPDPSAWSLASGSIRYPGQPPIPYSNRATYIQITEMAPAGPLMWSAAGPGAAESGDHAFDQVSLIREWRLRPRRFAAPWGPFP